MKNRFLGCVLFSIVCLSYSIATAHDIIEISTTGSNGHTSIHIFEYIGVTYNYESKTSTWCYKVTSGTSPSLSHWNLILPDCFIEENVLQSNEVVEWVDKNGIKFDQGYQDGESRTVCFTTDNLYPVKSNSLYVIAKASTSEVTSTDLITGPDCYVNGSITAFKFEDIDQDKVQSADEEPLSGWEMTLYSGSNCQTGEEIGPPVNTDANGNALFDNLAPGEYSVKETLQSGWGASTSLCQNITLQPEQPATITFGNYQLPGSITALKYWDEDANGVRDINEIGISDWEMQLYEGHGCNDQNATTTIMTTNGDGIATFSDLSPSEYSIREIIPPDEGWVAVNGTCRDVTLGRGESVQVEFGNQLVIGEIKGRIEVLKFYDLNGDEIQDDGEQDLPGWTMKLYSGSGCVTEPYLQEAETGLDGTVAFINLAPGTYSVQEVLQDGWEATNGTCKDVIIPQEPENQTVTISFGNRELRSITALKFYDDNLDGVKQIDEEVIEQWPITLYEGEACDGEPLQQLSTDENGVALFENLSPGTYSIQEFVPDDWETSTSVCQTISIVENSADILFGNRKEITDPNGPPPPLPVPTMSHLGLTVFALLAGGLGALAVRRKGASPFKKGPAK